MFDSGILQVILGLVAIYSLLGILTTEINTLYSYFTRLRARNLRRALEELVPDRAFRAQLLAHPMIRMVDAAIHPAEILTLEQIEAIEQARAKNVTWVESASFAEAVSNILSASAQPDFYAPLEVTIAELPNSVEKSRLRELLWQLQGYATIGLADFRQAVIALGDEEQKRKLLDALNAVEERIGDYSLRSGELLPLLSGVRSIKSSALRTTLQTILGSARSLADANDKLMRWFEDGMQRATARYKQQTQWGSVFIGFLLALVVNADALHLVNSLWNDSDLRQSLSARVAGETDALQTLVDETEQRAAGAGDESFRDTAADVFGMSVVTIQRLVDLQAPLGWTYVAVTSEMVQAAQWLGEPDPRGRANNLWNYQPFHNGNWLLLWGRKLAGLLVTTLAVAQGAPFWFDMLKRFTRAR
ncbi:MAG: hypothetical protein OXF83_07285 [Anaerolineaceae bacterium]|nr:hypothetical protein [Anaerolineaceae bacterium]